jgi:hypothetical protein
MNEQSHRICLTPTRNEAWIIKPFLAVAKTWTTDVLVADQGSSDGTLETLRTTPGVRVLINDSAEYNESHRQQLLLSAARELPGKRLLLALDADEALSANWRESSEWERICNAAPGTVLRFPWVNVLPGFQRGWIPPSLIACGFVDDGTEHSGGRIHNRRVPFPAGAPVIDLKEIVVLHFQFVAWDRMVSKHRWYQAWERIHHPERGPLELFRQYNHMHGSWDRSEMYTLRPEWLEGFARDGVDFKSLRAEPVTWWDKEIVQMLREHGPERFRKLAIWDKDWNAVAADMKVNGISLDDPRSLTEKIAHHLLAATQKHRANWGVRGLEWLLRSRQW